MKRKIALVSLLMLASFWAGWLLHTPDRSVQPPELVLAFPGWSVRNCVPAEAEELERYLLAVRVLDVYGASHNSLGTGAQRVLAHGIDRHDTESVMVCPPDGLYDRVAEIMAAHGMWGRGRVVEWGLQLASRIGKGRPEIIEAVAKVAFNEHPQRREFPNTAFPKDIRPKARTVLAGFGRDVASFGDIAYAQISEEDSLGTGAAQVAAAAGHPDALPKIATLMSELLSSVPEGEAIPWDKRNRLYELAYAISFSGEAGRDYLEPILQLMKKKVQSWAPPFDMVELRPKRMCAVLRRISQDKLEHIENYSYCLNDDVPYEQ